MTQESLNEALAALNEAHIGLEAQRAEAERLRARVTYLETSLASSAQEVVQLRHLGDGHGALQAAVDRERAGRMEAEEAAATASSRVTSLMAVQRELEAKVAATAADNAAAAQAVRAARASQGEAAKLIESLRGELENLKLAKKAGDATATMQLAEAQGAERQARVIAVEAQQQVSSLQDALASAQSASQAAIVKNTALEKQIAELTAERDAARRDCGALKAALSPTRGAVDAAHAALTQERATVAQLRAQSEALAAEIASLHDKAAQQERKHAEELQAALARAAETHQQELAKLREVASSEREASVQALRTQMTADAEAAAAAAQRKLADVERRANDAMGCARRDIEALHAEMAKERRWAQEQQRIADDAVAAKRAAVYEADTARGALERAHASHEHALTRASEAAATALQRERDRTAAVRAAGQKALEEQGRVVEAAETALKAAQEAATRAVWGMRTAQEDGDALRARVELLEARCAETQAELDRATEGHTVIVAGSGPGGAAAAATAALTAAREKARASLELADGLRSKLADAVRARDEAQRAMARLVADRKADWDAAMAAARAEVAMKQQDQRDRDEMLVDRQSGSAAPGGMVESLHDFRLDEPGAHDNAAAVASPWGTMPSVRVRGSAGGSASGGSPRGGDSTWAASSRTAAAVQNGDGGGVSSPSRRQLHLGPIASLPEENTRQQQEQEEATSYGRSSWSDTASSSAPRWAASTEPTPTEQRRVHPAAEAATAQQQRQQERSAGAVRAAAEASAALAAAEEALATQRARAGALLAANNQSEPPSALRLAAMAVAAAVAHEERR